MQRYWMPGCKRSPTSRRDTPAPAASPARLLRIWASRDDRSIPARHDDHEGGIMSETTNNDTGDGDFLLLRTSGPHRVDY